LRCPLLLKIICCRIRLQKSQQRNRHQRNLQTRSTEINYCSLLSQLSVVGLLGALAWDFILQIDEDKATGRFKGTEHNAVLAITVFIQAMIAFFGILNLEEPHRTKVSPVTKGGMRSAIAGALVVTYLFLVIFHCVVEFTGGTSSTTDSFVNNFTWIVGLTIAFYFASEAGIHAMNSFKPQPKPHQSRPNGSTSEIRLT
jgi:hypothetical protein